MRRCFDLARSAVARGSHPFGALLAKNGEVVLEARNTVADDGSVGHAELNLVRNATATLGREALTECSLYTSTEPCAMCAGAIYWARIPRLVFGCSVEGLHSITEGTLTLPCRTVFSSGDRTIEIVGPILEDEAIAVHQEFWPHRE
jgi:tRNA(Arg) A34 adenosine deaminase TadA